jgi:multisubunit Na+/H+ antiporter MnhB subunit
MTLALLFAVIASVLALSRIVVIYRSLKEKVRTGSVDPVPWMIWGALGLATLLPQVVEVGWRSAMLFSTANVVVNAAVVGLAWWSRRDAMIVREETSPDEDDRVARNNAITIGVVVVGIAFWVISGNALFGVVFSLFADFMGVVRTWHKAWDDPDGERVMTWLLAASAGGCAVVSAVYAGETIILLYPVYAISNALATAGIVVVRRGVLHRQAARRAQVAEAGQ